MDSIINSAPNIKLGYPPNALTFVERHYPKISCPDLRKLDALCELYESNRIPKEFQMCGSEELLASEYNGDIRNPKIDTDYNELLRKVYERSILAYVETEPEFQQLRVLS
jgi:hypothetical protein